MKKTKMILGVAALLMGLSLTSSKVSAEEVKENDNTYYVVESGDTLSNIADKYGVDFTNIHGNNEDDIEHADAIEVGQKLLVGGKDFDKDKFKEYKSKVQEYVYVVEQTYEQPVSQEVYQEAPVEVYQAPAQESSVSYSGDSSSAKEWIAQQESSGSYSAVNGQYQGRYQLGANMLNGDWSVANQEATADRYVSERYGSWESAKAFWQNNGWY